MPSHPITFLWVQQEECERGMTSQEVERAARLAARARIVPSDRQPVLEPVTPRGGPSALGAWVQWLSAALTALTDLGHRWPRPASTQTGSTGA